LSRNRHFEDDRNLSAGELLADDLRRRHGRGTDHDERGRRPRLCEVCRRRAVIASSMIFFDAGSKVARANIFAFGARVVGCPVRASMMRGNSIAGNASPEVKYT